MTEPFEVPLDFVRTAGYDIEDCGYETPCWVWHGTRGAFGHGRITYGGRLQTAHRVYWEYHKGRKVAKGKLLHHLCENPSCVNPDHLVEMTMLCYL